MLQATNGINLNKTVSGTGFRANTSNTFKGSEETAPKNNNSTKWEIGLGLTCLGAIAIGVAIAKGKGTKSLLNKTPNKTVETQENNFLPNIEDIQSHFSKIFEREVSKQEANEMALKYKEIFKNEDNSKFTGKLFEQLKKDYKLPEMKFYLDPLENGTVAAYSSFNGGLTYNITLNGEVANLNSIRREDVVKALVHELKHAKQDEIMFRTNFQETIKAYAKREEKYNSGFFRESLSRCNNDKRAALIDCENRFKERLIEGFKNLEQLPTDSPLYKKGEKYLENLRNYIMPEESYSGYRNQIIESEAFDSGENLLKIYKQLMG